MKIVLGGRGRSREAEKIFVKKNPPFDSWLRNRISVLEKVSGVLTLQSFEWEKNIHSPLSCDND